MNYHINGFNAATIENLIKIKLNPNRKKAEIRKGNMQYILISYSCGKNILLLRDEIMQWRFIFVYYTL